MELVKRILSQKHYFLGIRSSKSFRVVAIFGNLMTLSSIMTSSIFQIWNFENLLP